MIPALIILSFIIWPQTCFAGTGRLSVVTSVFPLYEFSRATAGQSADVYLLVPPGAEPHTWEPKPSDINRIREANLFVFMGHEMEPWVSGILRSLRGSGPRILEASRGLTSPSENSSMGPHLWLDLSLSGKMVGRIEGALVGLDPASGAVYRKNAAIYREELRKLDDLFRAGLSRCNKSIFVFGGHSAFGYLARRYGLEQIPVYGISPNAEPSPRHVVRIIKTVRKNHLKVIYFEDLVNPRLAQVIARETGAETMPLYPAGNVTALQWKEGVTFLDLMKLNLANLRQGLECE
ncbi:MAG: zinc ABC transporter solute-binding protein [Deltaproteobacteria bacterium]|nr:zinc ABC transporter solute-binding protein [Deltaproteobacteria bacterium]